MTTANDIIKDALQELGVVGAGDTVQPEDAALGLRRLNQVLQTLANSPLMRPVLAEVSVTLTSAQTYTIGPSGAVVTARPLKVMSASTTDSAGNETPVGVINAVQWAEIFNKGVTGGPPLYVWYEAATTNGIANVYPKAPGYTLILRCQTILASFASPTTSVSLPEGYETMLGLMLADALAPAYGRQLSPDSRRRMMGATAVVRRTNSEPLLLSVCDPGYDYQIERGY